MATSMGSGPTATTAPRLLPHQLVPRDGRSSYIRRVDTLAGPGAYVIPSAFKTKPVNTKMREIHQEQFGRDFARQQRLSQSTTEDERVETDDPEAETALTQQERRDRYLERRERLRELLQAVGYPDRTNRESPSIVSPDSTTLSKTSAGSLPLSPSLSCTSNYDVFVAGYRQQQQRDRAKNHGSTRSLRSPTSPTSASTYDVESIGFVHDSPRKALSPKTHVLTPFFNLIAAPPTRASPLNCVTDGDDAALVQRVPIDHELQQAPATGGATSAASAAASAAATGLYQSQYQQPQRRQWLQLQASGVCIIARNRNATAA